MINKLKRALQQVVNPSSFNPYCDFDTDHHTIIKNVKNYTMTSRERLFSLIEATKYVVEKNIVGDIVECGVWRGGSMMTVIHTLQNLNHLSKFLYLYDTYEGMSDPTDVDYSKDGNAAIDLLKKKKKTKEDTLWAYATLEDVKENIYKLDYPKDRITFIKGKVEDTIPRSVPHAISLLRLDTDWYESTKHELVHLFPLLSSGGVIIIDDYGHWQGAKKAVDEYFEENKVKVLLNRIDYTGRIVVKL